MRRKKKSFLRIFVISIISILGVAKTYTIIVIVAPLIVLALPIFDTTFAVIRRIVKGKSPNTLKLNDMHLNEPQVKRKSSGRLAKI